MTFWIRAAAFAALASTMSGLLATSTPGLAAEIAPAAHTPFPARPPVGQGVSNEGENVGASLPVPVLPVDDAAVASVTAHYASLDDAVAAQDDRGADEAMRCLAGAIYFEAKGEPLAGQLAVAEVILNRARSGRFADDVCGVVLQRGQFGFVRDGAIPTINAAAAAWKRAIAVAKVAIADVWDSPASSALYFNAIRRAPGNAIRIAAIGNHVFYR